ncbi:MAG: phosphate ABC transporter substrate-binding protein [Proteobacteria bacterium]|nr:MAG: phosphate ABC transporter substrate-binding protein [Pseudomonadota bacterium]
MQRIILSLLAATAVAAAPISLSIAQERSLTWVGCGISKKGFMAEMAEAYYKKTGVNIVIQGGGATKGIRMVSAGEADLGGSCRDVITHPIMISPISEERWSRMNPVAWDALVVIVHKDNVVTDITMDQVRDILKGRIDNWTELGGADRPVEVYVRDGKISGVGRTIRELVFSNYQEDFVADHVMPSSGPLEQAIEKNPDGIGVTGISSARRRDVRILRLDGVTPSYDRIRDGGYGLYRPLYLVTPMKVNVNPDIENFLEFVKSEEGKAIMRKVGTVPHEDAIPTWLKYLERREAALLAEN